MSGISFRLSKNNSNLLGAAHTHCVLRIRPTDGAPGNYDHVMIGHVSEDFALHYQGLVEQVDSHSRMRKNLDQRQRDLDELRARYEAQVAQSSALKRQVDHAQAVAANHRAQCDRVNRILSESLAKDAEITTLKSAIVSKDVEIDCARTRRREVEAENVTLREDLTMALATGKKSEPLAKKAIPSVDEDAVGAHIAGRDLHRTISGVMRRLMIDANPQRAVEEINKALDGYENLVEA